MDNTLRLVRIQLVQVIDMESIIASTCLGGLRRSTLYAELRLFGEGIAFTPAFQTVSVGPGDSWIDEIMDLHLTEHDMYTRVLGISVYAIDILGLSVRVGEAKVPLTPFELLKHQIVISEEINLTEEASEYEEVTTCRLRINVAVWTNADVEQSLVLEVWEHQRYAHGEWSISHLRQTDRLGYVCCDNSSMSWEDVEPEVPAGYVEVLGWSADKSHGDEHGWFYAPTFDGPWHNSSGSFLCRRRLQVKRVLLASYQGTKQARFELMQLDHILLVQQFEDVQRLLKGRWIELQEQETRHGAQLLEIQTSHSQQLEHLTSRYEDELQKEREASATAKANEAALASRLIEMEKQIRELESDGASWRAHLATHNEARFKVEEIERKRTSTSPRLFRIQLHRARDLVAADSALMGGKSDPYVIFDVDGVKHKSTMIKRQLNPIWYNEIYDFEMTEGRLNGSELFVQVYDHDQFSPDELIGFTTISIESLEKKNDPREAMWFSLQIPTDFANQKCKSSIQLQFEFGNWLDQDAKQFVMWENERYARGQWSSHNLKSTDRRAWSVGGDSANAREEISPKIPLGMESYLGWAVDRNHGDEQGWFYAASFEGPWLNSMNSSSVARRRKWTQRCTMREPKKTLGIEDRPHSVAA